MHRLKNEFSFPIESSKNNVRIRHKWTVPRANKFEYDLTTVPLF